MNQTAAVKHRGRQHGSEDIAAGKTYRVSDDGGDAGYNHENCDFGKRVGYREIARRHRLRHHPGKRQPPGTKAIRIAAPDALDDGDPAQIRMVLRRMTMTWDTAPGADPKERRQHVPAMHRAR